MIKPRVLGESSQHSPCSDAGRYLPRVGDHQAVETGDVVLSIEAMKIGSALHAKEDGTVAEILVKAVDQIDAKDLLNVYSG